MTHQPNPRPDAGDDATPGATPPADVHVYVLLDRSGSMAAMVDDVIGGFNGLLADQRADGADARMTFVQFDTVDVQHTVADAVPIAEVLPLDRASFQPRGGTPLLDATGILLGRAAARATERKASGLAAEEVVFVSITDGHENSSHEYRLATIRQLVDAHTAAGWDFVFLGAGVDVYGEAGSMGYAGGSVQAFAPDGAGSTEAFASLSRSMIDKRARVRRGDLAPAPFFVDKDAEADRDRRRGA
ncbi:MAG: VWA domain-containing protein [Acidimicrobiales bacterium]|nr:VWA domain-containing protein [Acidimicrobiales bacterium]